MGLHGAGGYVKLLGNEGQAATLHEVAAHFSLAWCEAQGLGEAVETRGLGGCGARGCGARKSGCGLRFCRRALRGRLPDAGCGGRARALLAAAFLCLLKSCHAPRQAIGCQNQQVEQGKHSNRACQWQHGLAHAGDLARDVAHNATACIAQEHHSAHEALSHAERQQRRGAGLLGRFGHLQDDKHLQEKARARDKRPRQRPAPVRRHEQQQHSEHRKRQAVAVEQPDVQAQRTLAHRDERHGGDAAAHKEAAREDGLRTRVARAHEQRCHEVSDERRRREQCHGAPGEDVRVHQARRRLAEHAFLGPHLAGQLVPAPGVEKPQPRRRQGQQAGDECGRPVRQHWDCKIDEVSQQEGEQHDLPHAARPQREARAPGHREHESRHAVHDAAGDDGRADPSGVALRARRHAH